MELFETKKVFNRQLFGRAVRIKGYDQNGDKVNELFIVKEYHFDHIVLISRTGSEWTFYMGEFNNPEQLLTLTVLKEEAE